MTCHAASLLLTALLGVHPSGDTEPTALRVPPMDLSLAYRGWLTALQEEDWERAAARVPPEELVALQKLAIDQMRRRGGRQTQTRLVNLGVRSVGEAEALTPQEFFAAVLSSGGSPIPGFLRAATFKVVEGEVSGDTGWLLIRLQASKDGGEQTLDRVVRQEFVRREGVWYVSLKSPAGPLAPPPEPETAPAEAGAAAPEESAAGPSDPGDPPPDGRP